MAIGNPIDVADLLVYENSSNLYPNPYGHSETPWLGSSSTYISKKDIVSVERFDSFACHSGGSIFRAFTSGNRVHESGSHMTYYMEMFSGLSDYYPGLFKCSCRISSYIDILQEQEDQKVPYADCTCPVDGLFPLYEMTVKNTESLLAFYDYDYDSTIPTSKRRPAFISPTITYLVHPDERHHVQRFLAGTDDSVQDLIQELRYHPMFGSQTALARQDFDERTTKRARPDGAL